MHRSRSSAVATPGYQTVSHFSQDGSSALCRAAHKGHVEALRLLLQSKADVNAADKVPCSGWSQCMCRGTAPGCFCEQADARGVRARIASPGYARPRHKAWPLRLTHRGLLLDQTHALTQMYRASDLLYALLSHTKRGFIFCSCDVYFGREDTVRAAGAGV
jgi:hypothetical protein